MDPLAVGRGAAHRRAQGDGNESDRLEIIGGDGDGGVTEMEKWGGKRDKETKRQRQKAGDRKTEDLTWGYKTPQGQLYILQIRRMPRGGVQ